MPTLAMTNARVITMDPGLPLASGIIIDDGKSSRVIPLGEDPPLFPGTAAIDLAGKTLLPGLIDSHLHLQKYAESLQKIDLLKNILRTHKP